MANDPDYRRYQYQRPRPCNATPVTIAVVTSIMATVVVMMLRYATRRMLGMKM
jgi:hypothetical protein